MRRSLLFLLLVALAPALGLVVWLGSFGRAQPGGKPPSDEPIRRRIPLTQLILFNTGVGYFQREGNVEGTSRIDLSFPTTDVNDLLKSLSVDDGGKPGVISYDGTEQVEERLRGFNIDLTGNPTFGQILNQARGARVEVVLENTGGAASTPVTGTIVGMESHWENGTREIHQLNLLSSEGMRRLPLERVSRLRFLDPVMEDEFRRALGVIASGHNSTRRSLSLHLRGEGKRDVKISYVVESPIWKASYRLTLDGKDAKPMLRGCAIVQNSTEEDWKDVRLVLVSGRPITFQMDLAQPLFVPRPRVEPEVYASLRPPVHAGAAIAFTGGLPGGGLNLGMALGGFQVGGAPSAPPQGTGLGGAGFGLGGGYVGHGGGLVGGFGNRYQINLPVAGSSSRLTYEDLVQRRQESAQRRQQARDRAQQLGDLLASTGETLESLAVDAGRIGQGFRYAVKQNLTLSRQKSALVPVIDEPVALTRYSIFNPAAHPRFPLLSVRMKNTTGQHLQQGPISLFDAGAYVGDSRLPDMGPNEERLLSYAMDLGVEIQREEIVEKITLEKVEIVRGQVHTRTRQHKETPYRMWNRSDQPRTLLVEHSHTEPWKLVGSTKPFETAKDHHRFEWKTKAGETLRQSVTEERVDETGESLLKMPETRIASLLGATVASKAVKEILTKAREHRQRLEKLAAEKASVQQLLVEPIREQERLNQAVLKIPAGSITHKRFVEKYDRLESQIEALRKDLGDKAIAEKKEQASFEAYLATQTAVR